MVTAILAPLRTKAAAAWLLPAMAAVEAVAPVQAALVARDRVRPAALLAHQMVGQAAMAAPLARTDPRLAVAVVVVKADRAGMAHAARCN